jgi:serine protease Do
MNRFPIHRKWTALVTGLVLSFMLAAPVTAQMMPETFSGLAEKAQSSVVNIRTVKVTKQSDRVFRHFFGPFQQRRPGDENNPFHDFFGPFGRQEPPSREFRQQSLGSGFMLDSDGYIVTNNHVVEDADEIKVRLTNGKEFDAEIVGRDPKTDLALIRIAPSGDLAPLPLGDSDALKVGEWVVAIGSPFGLEQTVTAGIVSAKGRVIGAGPYDDFIQTDASINPGNSGGPLLNMDGEVIGINTAIVAGGRGIGFAVPGAMAEEIVKQLRENKEVLRGWLGVTIQSVDENTARALDLDEPRGALVASVINGEPADRAGIRQGDVILAVNGVRMAGSQELTRAIAGFPPGEEVVLTVWRKGREKKMPVTLGKRELQKRAEKPEPGTDEPGDILGMSLRPLAGDQGEAGDSRGLAVTSVRDGSPADRAEIREGDLILQVNQLDVASIQDLKRAIESEGKNREVLLFLLKRGGRNIFRTVKIAE